MTPILLSALGNRAWGEDIAYHKWAGLFLMTMAAIIHRPHLILWTPAIAAFLFLFRCEGTGPLLEAKKDLPMAIIRAALIIPYVAFIYWRTGAYWGFFIWPLIAVSYYVAPKGSVAEFLAGAVMGAI